MSVIYPEYAPGAVEVVTETIHEAHGVNVIVSSITHSDSEPSTCVGVRASGVGFNVWRHRHSDGSHTDKRHLNVHRMVSMTLTEGTSGPVIVFVNDRGVETEVRCYRAD